MNFKDEYENIFSQIKADDEFKSSLVNDMNSYHKSFKRNYVYGSTAIAMAAMVLVIVAGLITGVLGYQNEEQLQSETTNIVQNNTKPEEDVQIKYEDNIAAQPGQTENFEELEVSELSWYAEAESAHELLEIFGDLISGDNLNELYMAKQEDFSKSHLLDNIAISTLVEALENAVEGKIESYGEIQYYKAVFESGMVIKFQIIDASYLKLEDTGTVYILK